MQTVFHSGGNLALKRNHMLKKADRETSTYECFASLFFLSPLPMFPPTTQCQCEVALCWDTATQRLGAQHQLSLVNPHGLSFPKLLDNSHGFVPRPQLPVELPIQPPFCSHIKPNILPFPHELLQPNSLANPPRTQMKSVKVCPLYKQVPALLHKSFLDHVQKIADLTPAGCQMYFPSWEISPPLLVWLEGQKGLQS